MSVMEKIRDYRHAREGMRSELLDGSYVVSEQEARELAREGALLTLSPMSEKEVYDAIKRGTMKVYGLTIKIDPAVES